MEYTTKQHHLKLVLNLTDDAKLCPYCYHELREVDGDGSGGEWYCPNEMCLNAEQGKIRG